MSTTAKVVLLTGASTGLGLAIAKRLLRSDYQLILTARESSLSRFAQHGITESEKVLIRPLDVALPEHRFALLGEIHEKFGSVYALINNAGIAYRSVVEHVSEPERLNQMAINFRSPLALIRMVLPGMREQRTGRIINISSVGGMMAMPTMAVYSASKFALEGASEALYYEVKPWNIFVTLLQPGFIHSEAFEKVPYTEQSKIGSESPSDPYHQHYRNMEGFISRMMRAAPASSDSVAKHVIRVLEHPSPPLRVPATIDARVFDILRRVLPRRIYHWALYRNLPRVRDWGPS